MEKIESEYEEYRVFITALARMDDIRKERDVEREDGLNGWAVLTIFPAREVYLEVSSGIVSLTENKYYDSYVEYTREPENVIDDNYLQIFFKQFYRDSQDDTEDIIRDFIDDAFI